MTKQQENSSISTSSLVAKIALLERALDVKDSDIAERNSVIAERNSVIAAKESAMSKLTADYNAVKFQLDQLKRMIYGSKENILNQSSIQINCLLNLSQRQLK